MAAPTLYLDINSLSAICRALIDAGYDYGVGPDAGGPALADVLAISDARTLDALADEHGVQFLDWHRASVQAFTSWRALTGREFNRLSD